MRFMPLAAAGIFSLLAFPALAANFEVHMLNKGEAGNMVFEPGLTRIAVGDTVTFIAIDKGHNAETLPGMAPEGTTPFKGKVNEEIVVTFDQPGVYGVRCQPHFPMGMVGLIAVGVGPFDVEALKAVKVPPMAKKRLEPLFEELEH